MKKWIVFAVLSITFSLAHTQMVVSANNVRLVTSSTPYDPLYLHIGGSIRFTGSTRLEQHGNLEVTADALNNGGHWTDLAGGVISPSSDGTIWFRSKSHNQDIAGPTCFPSLAIDGAGITLHQSNKVTNQLLLINGLVHFANSFDSLYMDNGDTAAILFNRDPLSTTSWINGRLSRNLDLANGVYLFPIGKTALDSLLYAPIRLQKQNANPCIYTAAYFPDTPVDYSSANPFIRQLDVSGYWDITSSQYAALADNYSKLSLSWRRRSQLGEIAADFDSLLIAHYIYGGGAYPFIWEPEIAVPLSTVDSGSTTDFGVFSNQKFIGDYSYPHRHFAIGVRTVAQLPINGISFWITAREASVMCEWRTPGDVQVRSYTVERSIDNEHFHALTSITSMHNPGPSTYNFIDRQPVNGWNFYRICMHRDDGIQYSITRKAYFSARSISVSPNPAAGFINVSVPGTSPVQIQLLDATGHLLASFPLTGNTTTIRLSAFPAGIYTLRCMADGVLYTRRFVHVSK